MGVKVIYPINGLRTKRVRRISVNDKKVIIDCFLCFSILLALNSLFCGALASLFRHDQDITALVKRPEPCHAPIDTQNILPLLSCLLRH